LRDFGAHAREVEEYAVEVLVRRVVEEGERAEDAVAPEEIERAAQEAEKEEREDDVTETGRYLRSDPAVWACVRPTC
jgi:hypothetical protein